MNPLFFVVKNESPPLQGNGSKRKKKFTNILKIFILLYIKLFIYFHTFIHIPLYFHTFILIHLYTFYITIKLPYFIP